MGYFYCGKIQLSYLFDSEPSGNVPNEEESPGLQGFGSIPCYGQEQTWILCYG